jgi:hypothetical protein
MTRKVSPEIEMGAKLTSGKWTPNGPVMYPIPRWASTFL